MFPAWATSNGTAKIDLGFAWFLDPPPRLGPEAFRGLDMGDRLTEEDRRLAREHVAAGFGDPEVNWFIQGYAIVVTLTVVIAAAFAFGDPRRRASAG